MSESELPLRAARLARGWSQSRAADELAALAAARGVGVAAPASLKTQLSRWENQHALPEEHYRALLRELYRSTDAELGLLEPTMPNESESEIETLRARLAASSAIDQAATADIREQLRATREVDARLGTVAAAGSARAQLSYLEEALQHTLDSQMRARLGPLLVDAATLCGQHALDQGRPATAWRYYETAKIGAREAGSGALLGYAMAEQAAVLLDLAEAAPATSLVEAAITAGLAEAPGSLRAFLHAARGEALANAGERREAQEAYRTAESELSRARPKDSTAVQLPLPQFDLVALRRRRGHARRLVRDTRPAIEDLESALRGEPRSTPARDVAATHLDLAWAYRDLGSEAEAAAHARLARELALRIGSHRVAGLLDHSAQPAEREVSRS